MKHIELFEHFSGMDVISSPSVEYVGKAGDKVTILLQDGGYI